MSVDLLIDVLMHWQMQNDLQTYTPPLYKCLSLRDLIRCIEVKVEVL
jgi:hypothetical protein